MCSKLADLSSGLTYAGKRYFHIIDGLFQRRERLLNDLPVVHRLMTAQAFGTLEFTELQISHFLA